MLDESRPGHTAIRYRLALPGGFPSFTELSRTAFDRRGVLTEELVVQWDAETRRVMWCRAPLEAAEIDGVPSLIVFKDVPLVAGDDSETAAALIDDARRRLPEMYDAYYGGLMTSGPTGSDITGPVTFTSFDAG